MHTPRVVVITGASGGLGQALTRLHLDKGDLVIAASRKPVNHESLSISSPNRERLFSYALHVENNEDVRRFAAWVHVRFGTCDILYNNAGVAVFEPLVDMTIDELEETLRTNISGVMYTTRAFLPMMLDHHQGHIVNIASLAGQVATAKASVYAASKAAVIRFSEGLQHELAGSGVHVTCALPGPIDTPFLEKADRTGAYRSKVARYLLSPDDTARLIYKAVEKKRSEVAMPSRLKMLSVLYSLLPQRLKQLVSPLLNRK
ncbi:oxidoreductase [Brevibacillus parabrevis]|uniref:SDR family NAD(P)-dependent oxidoreductase n=1 Tax=Brevibacillus parabrevis TaxID=54914 RepID=UPI0007ABAD14|nr:SDR family NAD(P)-dependent oxidoreductase [Brevibacillus parabrevis]KZE52476.1 oxidoreductase [Brevibacillus parabrevis]